MSIEAKLRDLADRWRDADAGERANAQLYLIQLTEALEVPQPRPKGSGYEFELPVRVITRDGTETTEFADLVKEDCFLLEAKDEEEDRSNQLLLRRAYGQARSYITHLSGDPPPYVLVLDVGRELFVWDRWSGTYGGFQAAHRINLAKLADRPEDIALLRDIWVDPSARDPRAKANVITKDIAAHLAHLATALEERGHDQELVARFLIRCVFTMFAEDVGLLSDEPFLKIAEGLGMEDPNKFEQALERLWKAMDAGEWFGVQKILCFNGHFFRDQTVVPLTREDLGVLLQAARADWQFVEPAIFGTLLTRALDPEERHRLGAEFTPRQFVERLIRPTIEEPIRERWTVVEAEVIQLLEKGSKRARKRALGQLNKFHDWLRSLKILDPACGSGNFLYVALEKLKQIESEVLRTIEQVTGMPDLQVEEVSPAQFYGIEVKPWAREIAELTLWIGYHQFWIAQHGHTRPPEPVLKDTRTFECRDAVLAWDPPPRPGSSGPFIERALPAAAEIEASAYGASGEEALDVLYANARPAEWPPADFIVGNPPYMGRARQREGFGAAYVEALRGAYPEVQEDADYVMYWWYRAAEEVAAGRTSRAGLITTSSIRQTQQRGLIEAASRKGVRVIWTSPDHPWVDEKGAADVRVAMTVLAKNGNAATLVEVNDEAEVVREVRVRELNSDLSAHADVAGAASQPLLANEGVASNGFNVVGRGFVLEAEEAREFLRTDPSHADILRPHLNGRDLASRPRGVWIIDFGTRSREEAEEYPVLFDVLRLRVKPEREKNRDRIARERWWRFARNRDAFRAAAQELTRYIATPYVARHRFFTFLEAEIAPDDTLRVVASDDAFHLGILSSHIHVVWALASGGRLGVGNDPRYNQTLCFKPYPFPACSTELEERIRQLAERLDQHRKKASERDERITLTEIYNILETARQGNDLSSSQREIYELAACGVLGDLHEELDRWVARAYGWSWPLEHEEILEHLVALHSERVAEEKRGVVRWLRPDYQEAKFGHRVAVERPELGLADEVAAEQEVERLAWPSGAVEQIAAVKDSLAVTSGSIEEIASRFHNARRSLVQRHLETLALMGEAQRTEDGRYHPLPAAPESYVA